ncbi:protein TASOR isoform X1 [Tachysurus vachellii]|uniref:protein TASOR isoform X1 n=2 Tax=Tachysurus vachellii TaxID=175792 RepID=UPI00296AA855|nr:protein TASOR isoform X1 [Tachysurus vachellii]
MECQGGRDAERAQPRAGNPPEPSCAANTPSQDGGPRSDYDEESAAEFRDVPRLKAPDTKRGSVTHRLAEEPPRLNFQIPRRNKEKRDLFQYLSSESREFAEILNIITSSYKDPASKGNFVYSKPRLVHNEPLEKDFIEKRKELKQDGRADKELAESFCFLLSDKVPSVCEKGLSVGSSWMSLLGNSSKGVYLCQFSDLLQSSPPEPGFTGELIIFKVIKGKVKSIQDNMSRGLDPTPKFDSHFCKNANRVTSLTSYKAFEHTQQYFYEYVDYDIASRPRQVCPYAVVSFQYKAKEAITAGPKTSPLQRSNSMPSGTESHGYTVWKGHFVNSGKEVYQASLHSISQPFLPFKIPDRLELGKVMRLDQVQKLIPSTLFSWDLYSGSHEVFKSGMYCSLFEVVVEKNKSGDGLAELFQELEKKGLVLMNMMNDKGFLFLLSSGQMSSSNRRRKSWKTTSQALFIYQQARDVSTLSLEHTTQRTHLTPVPQDSEMPWLNSFIPAYHYALSKVRCNPPANLSAGVEQQAHDYLSSLHESKPMQRVRIDYDSKLDDREKLFPAPRQRFNWEGYIHSYFYNPGLFTMPLVNTKKMVEMFRFVPESRSDPETTDATKAHSNNRKETKQKVLQDAHGLKRKLEEEEQNRSAKSSRIAMPSNGEGEGQDEKSRQTLADMLTNTGLQDTDLRKDKSQKALKVVELLNRFTKTSQDTDLRKDNTQVELDSKVLNKITKTFSLLPNVDGELEKSIGDTEKTLKESMTSLGLPTNLDTDLRDRFPDDDEQETQGRNYLEEETAGSLSSLEAFSPCSDSNGQQRNDNIPGERSIPWVLIPITGLKTERYSHRRDRNLEDPRFVQSPTVSTHTGPEKQDLVPSDQPDSSNMEPEPGINSAGHQDTEVTDVLKVSDSQEQEETQYSGVDCIVDEQISGFSAEVEDLLRGERVHYIPSSSSQTQRNPPQPPTVPFSEYISHYNTPFPVHSYINSFRDTVSAFLDPQMNRRDNTTFVSSSAPEVLPVSSSPLVNAPAHSPSSAAKPALTFNPSTLIEDHQQHFHDMPMINGLTQAEQSTGRSERLKLHQGRISNSSNNSWGISDAGESMASSRAANNEPALLEPDPDAFSDVISQLQPEVFNNLKKIISDVQKNTIHFYIYCVDDESDVCWEIKDYLTRLGNPECDPRTFLEKKDSQDKLLIVIQNIDIAAHIHKIPALVSLKKLRSVSFAGVDSLDDIKNHTYNELFVSGGFIVSDEFVLNPDFIAQERLQVLLQYLEELNTPESPWRWRVHCKTHKKVKEQSRCKSEALNVLNLLMTYHKKQIVEFLPYHECDAPSHQAPDLDCLVKLQAQNTRQRHVIYLTERRFKMFPHYSNSGIVVANIDDLLYSMASLIGEAGDKPAPSELHSCPTSPILMDEDMGLCSEIHSLDRISAHDERPSVCADLHPCPLTDPDPGLSDHTVKDKATIVSLPSPTTVIPRESDYKALRDVISSFRNARMQASSHTGQISPCSTGTNPLHGFLGQSDRPSSVPQGPSDDDVHSNQALGQMEEVRQREHIHAEAVSASEIVTVLQAHFGSGAQDSMSKTDSVVMETTSNTCDTDPTWNRTTDGGISAETPINPNISGTESGSNQEKEASEQGTTKETVSTTSSSRPMSVDKTATSRSHGSRGSKRPVPGRSPYGMNTLVTMDRMLQSSNLWPGAQASQNNAMGFRSQLLNNSVDNTFTHSGLRRLLPSSNMAWNNFAQGTATNMWGIQPSVGLGQVHRTPFIQSYAWHRHPAFQGKGHPPRGGYGGW